MREFSQVSQAANSATKLRYSSRYIFPLEVGQRQRRESMFYSTDSVYSGGSNFLYHEEEKERTASLRMRDRNQTLSYFV